MPRHQNGSTVHEYRVASCNRKAVQHPTIAGQIVTEEQYSISKRSTTRQHNLCTDCFTEREASTVSGSYLALALTSSSTSTATVKAARSRCTSSSSSSVRRSGAGSRSGLAPGREPVAAGSEELETSRGRACCSDLRGLVVMYCGGAEIGYPDTPLLHHVCYYHRLGGYAGRGYGRYPEGGEEEEREEGERMVERDTATASPIHRVYATPAPLLPRVYDITPKAAIRASQYTGRHTCQYRAQRRPVVAPVVAPCACQYRACHSRRTNAYSGAGAGTSDLRQREAIRVFAGPELITCHRKHPHHLQPPAPPPRALASVWGCGGRSRGGRKEEVEDEGG
eukprot:477194-Rhodomonas_salina.1